jgi:hypothetical protein
VTEVDGPWLRTSTKCFGPNGAPANGALGVHEVLGWTTTVGGVARASKGRGSARSMEAYGKDGNPATMTMGNWKMDRVTDNFGRVVDVRAFKLPGAPRLDLARMTLDYDERGNKTRMSSFDEAGEPTDPKTWWAGTKHAVEEWQFDELGRMIEHRWTRADGTPGGFGKPPRERYSYDQAVRGEEGWRPTRTAYFDADGEALEVDGIAARTVHYDRFGLEVHQATWDAAGELVNDHRGVALTEQEFDSRGLRTMVRYSDAEGEPVNDPSGCAEVRSAFDELGKLTKKTCDGEPQALAQ